MLFLTLLSLESGAGTPCDAHLIVIGVDGLSPAGIQQAHTPTLDRLIAGGAYTFRARAVMPTISSPNWASMIMGAAPEQHGVTSNQWETNRFKIAPIAVGAGGIFPTIFGVLREQWPDRFTACFYHWEGFGRLVEPGALSRIEHVSDAFRLIARARDCFRESRPAFLFVQLDGVDRAGHLFGWGSRHYRKAVEVVDGLIASLLEVVDEAGVSGATRILVTSDHGGRGRGHGGATMEEIEIPWILHGPGVACGREIRVPVTTYDTAATIAHLFDLKRPECWIGRPVLAALDSSSKEGPPRDVGTVMARKNQSVESSSLGASPSK